MTKKIVVKKINKDIAAPAKKSVTRKAPLKKVAVKKIAIKKVTAKKLVVEKKHTFASSEPTEKSKSNKKTDEGFWFGILAVSAVVLTVIVFLLIRVNVFYDNLKDEIDLNTDAMQEYFVNQLPPAEAAVDPAVSGYFYSSDNRPTWSKDDAYLGNVRGLVKIFYYADYNSQISRAQEKYLKELVTNYPDQVLLVRKDFPGLDALSLQSAKAARCAQEQGDYWKFHDILLAYLNHDEVVFDDVLYDEDALSQANKLEESKTFLQDLADRANLDLKKFDKCFNNPASEIINSNIIEGKSLGISGVPTIYINGQRFINEMNYQDVERLVKIVIDK